MSSERTDKMSGPAHPRAGVGRWLAASWMGWMLAVAAYCAEPIAQTVDPDLPSPFYRLAPAQLRPMTTDGPGATDTPHTVDAGHFQVELTLVQYARDQQSIDGENYRRDEWAIAPVLLKLGLYDSVDIQVFIEPYHIVRERFGTNTVDLRGFGDVTLRLKANVWGNDAGRSAFAVMPYWTFPTRSHELGPGRLEAGFIFPLSIEVARQVYFDLTPRLGEAWDSEQHRFEAAYSAGGSLGAVFWEDFFGYVELFASGREHQSAWVTTIDTGIVFALTDNVQINGGINIGLTRAADDWSPFVGVAWRY